MESFVMWPLLCEVSWVPAYETLMFLFLKVIHGLCHSERQSLHVVQFGWGIFHWIRVWWKHICSNGSHTSHRGRILLITLMRIMSCRSPLGRTTWMMSRSKFLGQMVEGVKVSICLFPLWQIHHGKAQCIPQAGGESVIEVISSQAFPLIWHLIRVCAFHHCYCFMNS